MKKDKSTGKNACNYKSIPNYNPKGLNVKKYDFSNKGIFHTKNEGSSIIIYDDLFAKHCHLWQCGFNRICNDQEVREN